MGKLMEERYNYRDLNYYKRFTENRHLLPSFVEQEMSGPLMMPFKMWTKKGFSIEQAVNKLSGPFVEIGGPTFRGFDLVNTDKLYPLYVSNISPGIEVFDEDLYFRTGRQEFKGYIGKLDFRSDASCLPIKDRCLGGVLVSYLFSEKLVQEAGRTLEPNGLLVVQGFRDEYIQTAVNIGFQLAQVINYRILDEVFLSAILIKRR